MQNVAKCLWSLVFEDPVGGQSNLIVFLVSLFYTKGSFQNSLKMRRWLKFAVKILFFFNKNNSFKTRNSNFVKI